MQLLPERDTQVVWRNISTPVKVKTLTQTHCCSYQSICCGWKWQNDCSITPTLNPSLIASLLCALVRGMIHCGVNICNRSAEIWKAHPWFLVLLMSFTSSLPPPFQLLSSEPVFALPAFIISTAQCSLCCCWIFLFHSSAACWQPFPNQVLKCRRKWVNLAPAVKPWKLWLSSQPSLKKKKRKVQHLV